MTETLYAATPFSAGENINDHSDELGMPIRSATSTDEIPVETLRAGDLDMTRDHGAMPLVWASSSTVTTDMLDVAPNKRPLRIQAGSLGNDLPRRDVDVSPQHRVLVRDGDGQEYLVSARHMMMAGHPGVGLRPQRGVFRLVHIAFENHQIALAEGAEMESFFTGPMAVRALEAAERIALVCAFPDLAQGKNPMQPARPFIKHRDLSEILSRAATA
ncbi:Hint domain-containing protein [Paracoccus sp. Z330]|uniref:Hint domain-containing protein n=1 Tax=Paracoccus onchidii TaxID=3017813 RepID=A0ABT4ZET2_9RHOB|nr:Hint domain-containing protein [Paracoccus onchidii]MDB6177769.1 Hint domain-containing protein [Paracoccus onchidii]